MAIINSCSSSSTNAGTFSTAVQATHNANTVFNLTQQSLVGTSISFTPPNTINLNPGSYIVYYSLMADSLVAVTQTVFVGLQLNGTIITNSTMGSATATSGANCPEAFGCYLINVNTTSTLRLVARSNVGFSFANVNAALSAINSQVAQLSLLKL